MESFNGSFRDEYLNQHWFTTRGFVAAFEGQYGMAADIIAVHAYDAMYILALAIREAGLNPQELRFYSTE